MTLESLTAWLLGVMLSVAPPGSAKRPPEARETAAAGKQRYHAIARTIAAVTLDPEEAPLFDGPEGRFRTAALVLAISYHESTWLRHVDLGINHQGRYWCMMQIAVGAGRDGIGKTPEGWSGKDLVASREKCFRRGLHILQRGKSWCAKPKQVKKHKDDPFAFLNHYASGHCDRGQKAVKIRVDTWRRWLGKYPVPRAGE